jgi:hypothetical protein
MGGIVKITRDMSLKFYSSFIPIYGYMVSGFSPNAGMKSGLFDPKRDFGFAEFIQKQIPACHA